MTVRLQYRSCPHCSTKVLVNVENSSGRVVQSAHLANDCRSLAFDAPRRLGDMQEADIHPGPQPDGGIVID